MGAESLELFVIHTIRGAFKSREVLEAEWPEDAPALDDDRVLLNNWAALVEREGWVLARLCVCSPTREQLMKDMPGLLDRSPAWLEARLDCKPMTWRVFFTGLAQAVAVHREGILRVISEQAAYPVPIEDALADAPVPAAAPSEPRPLLMERTVRALFAHLKALADIAYDLESQAPRPTELDDEDE